MFSPQHITKVTALGLAVGAIAAPTASAMPIGGIPTQASVHRAPAGWQLDPSAFRQNYSPQDKQVIPSSPPQAPTTVPVAVRHATPSGTSDWTYAGIGAGGALTIMALGVGGSLAFQRRTRRAAKPAAATAS